MIRRIAAALAIMFLLLGSFRLMDAVQAEHDRLDARIHDTRFSVDTLERRLNLLLAQLLELDGTTAVMVPALDLCLDRTQWLHRHQGVLYRRNGSERAREWGVWPQ